MNILGAQEAFAATKYLITKAFSAAKEITRNLRSAHFRLSPSFRPRILSGCHPF